MVITSTQKQNLLFLTSNDTCDPFLKRPNKFISILNKNWSRQQDLKSRQLFLQCIYKVNAKYFVDDFVSNQWLTRLYPAIFVSWLRTLSLMTCSITFLGCFSNHALFSISITIQARLQVIVLFNNRPVTRYVSPATYRGFRTKLGAKTFVLLQRTELYAPSLVLFLLYVASWLFSYISNL